MFTRATTRTNPGRPPGAPPARRVLQRSCACGSSSRGPAGTCAECRRKGAAGLGRDPGLRPSLAGHETEADRIAAAVARPGPAARTPLPVTPVPAAESEVHPPQVARVLAQPGRPLDESTRTFMESRFGHDFSAVRVHTGGEAAASADAVLARAYTIGNQVVFAEGEYRPETAEGRHLLAHELAHTLQQGGGEPHAAAEPSGPSLLQRAPPAVAAAGAAALAVGRVLLACIVGAAVSFGLERYVIAPIVDWWRGRESSEAERRCREIIASIIGCFTAGVGSVLFRWFMREASVTGSIMETFLERAILWLLTKGITVPPGIIAGLIKLGCLREDFREDLGVSAAAPPGGSTRLAAAPAPASPDAEIPS